VIESRISLRHPADGQLEFFGNHDAEWLYRRAIARAVAMGGTAGPSISVPSAMPPSCFTTAHGSPSAYIACRQLMQKAPITAVGDTINHQPGIACSPHPTRRCASTNCSRSNVPPIVNGKNGRDAAAHNRTITTIVRLQGRIRFN